MRRLQTTNRYVRVLSLILCVAVCAGAGLWLSGCGDKDYKDVVVLGLDGLDPVLVRKWMDDGHLPNFSEFRDEGTFVELGTSIPPQSPVAWANFITGMNPGGHGIFDFIHRSPAKYEPRFSTTESTEPEWTIEIGDLIVPLDSGDVELLRKGRAFWRELDDRGIPTTIFRVPSNYPPVDMHGHSLSGMGTPDLRGTPGFFSFWTDEPRDLDKTVSGGEVFEAYPINHTVDISLPGPESSFHKDSPESFVPMTVYLDPEREAGTIEIDGERYVLEEGQWTPWIDVSYDLIPGDHSLWGIDYLSFFPHSISGIVRFYLKNTRDPFQLYATPVNINPADPALPISTPEDYSSELYDEIGFYYTQGMAEDTKALDQEIFSDEDYLMQAGFVMSERMRMLERELARYEDGFLFFYFSTTDLNSHMFWRTMDTDHPGHRPEEDAAQQDVILKTYKAADAALGRVMDSVGEDTTILIMSDHGFAPYYRSFHLNTWLWKNGYLEVKDESRVGQGVFFSNVDWTRTKLYGVGLNGLFVNQVGREGQGIVRPGSEKRRLLQEVKEKLLAVKDPENDKDVVGTLYLSDDVYSGTEIEDGPDAIVGFNREYRLRWESALGTMTNDVFADNMEKWSGDHLMEASQVPGVLFANRKLAAESPRLVDMPVSILELYGIEKPEGMIGESFFQ